MHELGFDDLRLFARVAAMGTLSAVARERDVPVSQVSRSLVRIEKACGARLIHPSTHGLALTAEGETFLDYCHRLGHTLEELEGEFAAKAREPSGLVRVAACTVIAQYLLLPSLTALGERHPRLRVGLEVSDLLVYSDVDRTALHVSRADEAYPLGGNASLDTYLRIDKILAIAKRCGADAIHPGYGFLSENAGFAAACRDAGILFIGPSPESIAGMGDKLRRARRRGRPAYRSCPAAWDRCATKPRRSASPASWATR